MARYNLHDVKAAASYQWLDLISSLCRIDRRMLDGNHHACPKCGGTDRFRVVDETTGGLFCNQCFNSNNGDGLSAIQWLLDIDFPQSVKLVGDRLGVKPSGGRKVVDPAKHLEFIDWNESLAGLWCLKKKPIKPESLKLVGAKMAKYRKRYTVIAIPMMMVDEIKGWSLYNIDGGTLPSWTGKKQGDKPDQKKVLITAGSRAGIMGHWPENHKQAIKTEGPSDMLAMISLDDCPADVAVFCNGNGAKETCPKFATELQPKLAGLPVFVVHDCDQPGQDGAMFTKRTNGDLRPGWAPWIAKFASAAFNVVLPYEIQPTHGKDLRDWITEGHSFKDFELLVDGLPEIDAVEIKPELLESAADPDMLARYNMNKYWSDHKGKVVFWRGEFWKYKQGQYQRLDRKEMQSKVWASIREKFEGDYQAQIERNDEEIEPVRPVSVQLCNNVLSATESMVTLSANITQPCWLPDRTHRNYLSMKNCLIDLDGLFSGKKFEAVMEHSHEWFSAFRLPYDFDDSAKSEKWLSFVDKICDGDAEKVAVLQEWCGYLLWPDSAEQKFLVFEGEGGTGKSSFFAGVEAMLGTSNISNVSLENMDGFPLANTIGKMANIAGDVGRISGNEEAILKRYTGGGALTIDRKGIPAIEVKPSAKLMMAWNERPRFRDKSRGLWRRMVLVPLNKIVREDERIKGMDNSRYWEKEAPGIFCWAIVGLKRLLEQGGFSDCEASNDALKSFRLEANPCQEFITSFLEKSDHTHMKIKKVYDAYLHWCRSFNMNPMAVNGFGKEIKRTFPGCVTKQKRGNGKRYRYFEGINFSVEEIEGLNLVEHDLFPE